MNDLKAFVQTNKRIDEVIQRILLIELELGERVKKVEGRLDALQEFYITER